MVSDDEESGFAPQLLALAGTLAPNLHTLVLKGGSARQETWDEDCFGVEGPIIRSLALSSED